MSSLRKKRFLSFDTETTGVSPDKGDRVVEIGVTELFDYRPRRHFHVYINPERDMPHDAFKVHGLSNGFLRHCPRFADVVDDFLDFIDEDMLVAHNARFDMGFINMELKRLGLPQIPTSKAAGRVLDTLEMARRLFPGSPSSLDALCRRFKVNNRERGMHGALLDSQLLGDVFIELTIEDHRQNAMVAGLGMKAIDDSLDLSPPAVYDRTPRFLNVSDETAAAHQSFVGGIKGQGWYTA